MAAEEDESRKRRTDGGKHGPTSKGGGRGTLTKVEGGRDEGERERTDGRMDRGAEGSEGYVEDCRSGRKVVDAHGRTRGRREGGRMVSVPAQFGERFSTGFNRNERTPLPHVCLRNKTCVLICSVLRSTHRRTVGTACRRFGMRSFDGIVVTLFGIELHLQHVQSWLPGLFQDPRQLVSSSSPMCLGKSRNSHFHRAAVSCCYRERGQRIVRR